MELTLHNFRHVQLIDSTPLLRPLCYWINPTFRRSRYYWFDTTFDLFVIDLTTLFANNIKYLALFTSFETTCLSHHTLYSRALDQRLNMSQCGYSYESFEHYSNNATWTCQTCLYPIWRVSPYVKGILALNHIIFCWDNILSSQICARSQVHKMDKYQSPIISPAVGTELV
jgi:hypothetical protein